MARKQQHARRNGKPVVVRHPCHQLNDFFLTWALSYEGCETHMRVLSMFQLPDNWAEPYTFNELAVDGKKVSDISSWLSSSVSLSSCFISSLSITRLDGKTELSNFFSFRGIRAEFFY